MLASRYDRYDRYSTCSYCKRGLCTANLRYIELAALRSVDHLTMEIDNSNVPINIYIDLSKVFDRLNHSILLKKVK